jgi:hypothetical protein
MSAIKDRQRQIPNGFRFRIPEVRWQSAPFASFDTIVNQATAIINSNPALQNTYPTDRAAVANLVDQFNTMICEQNGWASYITGDPSPPPPKPMAPGLIQKLQNVAGAVRKLERGIQTLLEWETSGLPPVPEDVANWRASVCVQCPQNGKGDLSRFFTVPASEQIRLHMQRLHKLDLKTFHDGKLGVCEMCLCPLKLKVWCGLDLILSHYKGNDIDEFPDNCWIKQEAKRKNLPPPVGGKAP